MSEGTVTISIKEYDSLRLAMDIVTKGEMVEIWESYDYGFRTITKICNLTPEKAIEYGIRKHKETLAENKELRDDIDYLLTTKWYQILFTPNVLYTPIEVRFHKYWKRKKEDKQ